MLVSIFLHQLQGSLRVRAKDSKLHPQRTHIGSVLLTSALAHKGHRWLFALLAHNYQALFAHQHLAQQQAHTYFAVAGPSSSALFIADGNVLDGCLFTNSLLSLMYFSDGSSVPVVVCRDALVLAPATNAPSQYKFRLLSPSTRLGCCFSFLVVLLLQLSICLPRLGPQSILSEGVCTYVALYGVVSVSLSAAPTEHRSRCAAVLSCCTESPMYRRCDRTLRDSAAFSLKYACRYSGAWTKRHKGE